jgi:hypothetical protein
MLDNKWSPTMKRRKGTTGAWVRMLHHVLCLDDEEATQIQNIVCKKLRQLGKDPDKIIAESPFR